MRFGTSVFIDIFGVLIADSFNPSDSIKITAQDTVSKFLGLKFEDQSDGSALRNVIFEYGNSIRMLDCNITIDNCVIRYNTLNSSFGSGAISLFRSNSVISNCKIFRNRRAAIVSGANIASSPKILNNHIYENNTENANVPQINFGATGSEQMVIRGNVIKGLFTNCGGIAFLPIGSIPDLVIENNIITHNRYGIAILGGPSNVYINNNLIDSNNIQGSPSLGGSGLNFAGNSSAIVSRNLIRGNLWGITIQNTAKPNMGDLSSPDTTDIGDNEIYGNGNSGNIFDLFNNTPDTIKAENNYWGTNNIDSVEAHIFHNPDSSALGYVDYMPIRIITSIIQNSSFTNNFSFELQDAYPNPFNPSTVIRFSIPENENGFDVYSLKIFDITGRQIKELLNSDLKAGNYSINFNAADLPAGVYIYRLSNGSYSISKKLLLVK
ncbi:MAG: right-handed parallel beta-helix repeat-containing protein [Ignavibacteria bacterium]|nr:right-handed parallel beta-helix repeat-containing protein [Ignavibacteria bacterium]